MPQNSFGMQRPRCTRVHHLTSVPESQRPLAACKPVEFEHFLAATRKIINNLFTPSVRGDLRPFNNTIADV